MKDRELIQKIQEVMLDKGPLYVDDLLYEIDPDGLKDMSTKDMGEFLCSQEQFTEGNSGKWQLTGACR